MSDIEHQEGCKPCPTCPCRWCAGFTATYTGDVSLVPPPGPDNYPGSKQLSFPSNDNDVSNTETPVEEETTHKYQFWHPRGMWYHMQIGQVLHSRYRICAKLGWGYHGTAWLAEDMGKPVQDAVEGRPDSPTLPPNDRTPKYVCIKLSANLMEQSSRELLIMEHIKSIKTDHPGKEFIAVHIDEFKIRDEEQREYRCIVLPVLGTNYVKQVPKGQTTLDIDWLKDQLQSMLQALDFLHSEAMIVHGDIWPPNVCCAIDNVRDLAKVDQGEKDEPSPFKVLPEGQVVHKCRDAGIKVKQEAGLHRPILIDLGNSRIVARAENDPAVQVLKQKLAEELKREHEWKHRGRSRERLGEATGNKEIEDPFPPIHPVKDIRWVGGMFLDMMTDREIFRGHPDADGCQELPVSEAEVTELRSFLQKMKDADLVTELSAKDLLAQFPTAEARMSGELWHAVEVLEEPASEADPETISEAIREATHEAVPEAGPTEPVSHAAVLAWLNEAPAPDQASEEPTTKRTRKKLKKKARESKSKKDKCIVM